ncbi:MAG: zf-HC2 domain-containing protein [Blastocatellia bacterium]|nr:zf-HC2 domain-containing protein [Blastocatellia bacterium]MCS7157000.1 zf-HC2 domain-containing protein [Blastocatellia bacterium]MCX7752201.1 zf-HC2 domain-containing protein [Blastocatellia bacterium]MDW8167693.1 zf-HC2 domain-containing protein [Acidobacteriota bacterium]MDW8256292.1 zf-HC2 domain-containing protein [Acidobacteriota bacterium]
MRECAHIRRELSPYLDGELSPKQERILERHLTACSACARHLEELKVLAHGLRRLPRPAVPRDLADQILTALEGEHQRAYAGHGFLRLIKHQVFAHPKVASALMSLIITLPLLGALLSVLRPVPEIPLTYHHTPIALDAQQYGLLNGRIEDWAGSYTFPRLRSPGHLERLFHAAASDQLMVVTFVHPDGRASFVDLVAPSRPVNLTEVETSFSDVRFEPAKRAGQQPVSTQLVMLLHRLDVSY